MSEFAFLTSLRLSDSFLPVGTYTASYGIEQYVNDGRIETADELGDLVAAYLERLVGPADTVALGNAHEATGEDDLSRLLDVDERFHAATLPAEFRESSTKAGTQLLDLLGEDETVIGSVESNETATAYVQAVEAGKTPGHYPVVLGVLTSCAGISRRESCLINAYGFTTGLLGAAQRLGRFGHTEIQAQLSRLLPVIQSVCDEFADRPLSDLASFGPLAEIMGMKHERAERRLFMS